MTQQKLNRAQVAGLFVGHLDFSRFPLSMAGFGGLKPAGSGFLECSTPVVGDHSAGLWRASAFSA
jgi:hypothetical protein